MKLITVLTAFNPAMADVARSRLDASGFHPVITHEISPLSTDAYTLAPGGILVQVPEDEAEDALALLNAPPDPDANPDPDAEPQT